MMYNKTLEVKILCGIPASGKSTWAEKEAKLLEADGYTTAIVSRDKIRFSLIKDNEDYFSRERDVFRLFVSTINQCIAAGINYIFVDATHINPSSRRKLCQYLHPCTGNLVFEVIATPLQECLSRNNRRTGRARVPEKALKRMYDQFRTPMCYEFPDDKWGFGNIVVNIH